MRTLNTRGKTRLELADMCAHQAATFYNSNGRCSGDNLISTYYYDGGVSASTTGLQITGCQCVKESDAGSCDPSGGSGTTRSAAWNIYSCNF